VITYFNQLNIQNSLLRFVIICFLSISFTQSNAQSKEALRFEIDAKRGGMSYTSKDALPRGR
jgi:hypothetical protein